MSNIKCRAKNPAECPFHGRRIVREQNEAKLLERKIRQFEFEQQKKREADEKYVFVLSDIEKNSPFKKDAQGNPVISVYRSGISQAPKNRGVEKLSYEIADRYMFLLGVRDEQPEFLRLQLFMV